MAGSTGHKMMEARALVHPHSLLTTHRARALRWVPGIFASESCEPSLSFSMQGGGGGSHTLELKNLLALWKSRTRRTVGLVTGR